MVKKKQKVSIYLPQFYNGGIEKVMMNLAESLIEKGIEIDFVVNNIGFDLVASACPPEARIIELKPPNFISRLPKLIEYLNREKPTVLLSACHYTNEIAIVAKYFLKRQTRIIVSVHTAISLESSNYSFLSSRGLVPLAIKLLYRWADGIVTVSEGVKKDIINITNLSSKKMTTIYNPVITPQIFDKAKEPLNHPWFQADEPPVILTAGRLEEQKNYSMLIQAFAQVKKKVNARLVILGEGSQRSALTSLISELGLQNDILMPGFIKNPYPYIARAKVLVLSSNWEDLGNVLVEAMALGTPVISTDCPYGPSEILQQGRYGEFIPMNNLEAMIQAMLRVLHGNQKYVDSEWLKQFTIEESVQNYMAVLGIDA
ncbi:glycosyltransferase [Crocosphaera chwakensis]|uniref:Glycosyl transferase group 1 n=1 Tax=Crocosphaera chwakensis CCY0110 TaxID=391612 RepID=A3IMA9_9CHRO|nr:glycosyltransferase [Crocosphaera chwakensis]EAZ92278.1 glycosyl transferase group 1 [Crocosphaera chwakensis CCY0110]